MICYHNIQAKQILKGGKVADLLDPSLVNAYDDERIEKMVLAASLCIRRGPQFRPNISIVSQFTNLCWHSFA